MQGFMCILKRMLGKLRLVLQMIKNRLRLKNGIL